MLTPRQQALYRPLVDRAWVVEAERQGLQDAGDQIKRRWYEKELVSCVGTVTTKDCSRVNDFDTLMRHFASIVGDKAAITYWSRAEERRIHHWIEKLMRKLSVDWSYVQGVLEQMNLPLRVEDCPVDLLRRVAIALDVHARRHGKTG